MLWGVVQTNIAFVTGKMSRFNRKTRNGSAATGFLIGYSFFISRQTQHVAHRLL